MDSMLYLLLVAIAAIHFPHSASANILEGPTSVNTTINRNATFSCFANETIGSGLYSWEVNGDTIVAQDTNLPHGYYTATLTNGSQLIITGTINRNNSIINCSYHYISASHQVSSTSVVLMLQGILDAPANMSTHISNEMLHVSWSSPYSLANVPLYYTVALIHNETIIISTYNTTLTSQSITLDASVMAPCQWYGIEIYAVNEAGKSQPANSSFLYSGSETQLILLTHI
jgi:hypothetical protein